MSDQSAHNRKFQTGWSKEDFEYAWAEQKGQCAICFVHMKSKGQKGDCVAADHCHATKRRRGLLCSNCNKGLGLFRDNPHALRSAAEYLEMSAVLPIEAGRPVFLPYVEGTFYSAPDQETYVLAQEWLSTLKLSTRQQHIFRMYAEGWSFEAIGRRLGVSPQAIQKAYNSIRKRAHRTREAVT